MRRLCFVVLVFAFLFPQSAQSWWEERQLTFDTDRNHQLDNNLNWSPDCKWVGYDTRAFGDFGGIGNTLTLEKVNIDTQSIIVMYTAPNVIPLNGFGPGTGAVSFFPYGDAVVAIRGLDGIQYGGTARFGAMVTPTDGSVGSYGYYVTDARDVTPPFTPGALRGGSHRHEPSGDGEWVGFTYNDQIMESLGTNLRTIGVTKLGLPVNVDSALGNQNGNFTVLVVKVKPVGEIVPGSDDIYQGSDDSWVGEYGYQKPDGTWQRARAFIGRTVTESGGTRNEVYIADIPEDITVAGPDGPLEGTETTFPMPPAGTVQRRLTYSDSNCGGIIRCSLDGKWIAFTRGGQVWIVSPLGGDPIQVTTLASSASKPWWDPSGAYLYCISDNSIWMTNVIEGDPAFGESVRITDPTLYPGIPPDALCVSPDGQWIAFNRKLDRGDGVTLNQVFIVAIRKLAILDIKPGDCPNQFTVNKQNKGKIPMAILGSPELDVADIDVASININGVAFPVKSPSVADVSGPGESVCDCGTGPDGYPDLVLHFSQEDVVEALGLEALSEDAEVDVTVFANQNDGLEVQATDCMTIHFAGKGHE
ncbi:MAG: DUF3748 domain-containing protein [Candidatus Omnitrophica bacterium]|nr:DUF3748 domain-containing protein [Candidatus Omnitrophota bacterium]